MVRTEIVRDKLPDALLAPVPPAWSKPVKTTGDFIERGDQDAAALRVCRAQVDAIRKWSDADIEKDAAK